MKLFPHLGFDVRRSFISDIEVIRLHSFGLSDKEISLRLGCCKSSIWKRRQFLDLPCNIHFNFNNFSNSSLTRKINSTNMKIHQLSWQKKAIDIKLKKLVSFLSELKELNYD